MTTDPLEPQANDLPEELAAPAHRALNGAGYHQLDQLAGVREAKIAKLHGIGPNALSQLRRALHARGLAFGG